jgi:hypothetical protein
MAVTSMTIGYIQDLPFRSRSLAPGPVTVSNIDVKVN